MTSVTVKRRIAASRETVFRSIAYVEGLPEVVPDILRVEFLGEQKTGIGTRFVETRRMGKKEMATELEITEWVENERARMVADSHGTIWDTVFTVTPASEGHELTIAMDARAQKLMPRIMNPIFKGLFRKGLSKHIDHVKAWCEAQ